MFTKRGNYVVMKKILIVLINSFFLFAMTACGTNQEYINDTENQSGYDTSNSILSDNPNNVDIVPENSEDFSKSDDTEINESAKMEILLSRGDKIETYAITETDKVSSMYDILNALTYENAEDVSFNDYSINIYFYDVNDNMTQAYHIYENYLKLNGLPDTYRITNTDFDFDEFNTDVYALISKVTGTKKILPQ